MATSLSPSTTSTRKLGSQLSWLLVLLYKLTACPMQTCCDTLQIIPILVSGTQQVLEEEPCEGTLCLQGAGSHG